MTLIALPVCSRYTAKLTMLPTLRCPWWVQLWPMPPKAANILRCPSVQQPPYARPLPDVRANTLDLMNEVWYWGAQNVGVHNPFPDTFFIFFIFNL
ncbi:hypothetical protein M404DRAFT_897724 [Pisolithus tinctorius Marx 270]|uniref:Uncharacterized protein n=1 Tax=Pisolithus tinctorius Marx 270 TaxID=870435 RepID=A0A0C3N8H5_PISTI|nr:hypothetical protein M404DRAFT_897724 [Pisolithus tinctorius Marx 270]